MRGALLALLLATIGSGLAAISAMAGAPTRPVEITAEVRLWRLDCGVMEFDNLDWFSDTYAFEGMSGAITDSCYLIRHGDKYLIWDTGLGEEILGAPRRVAPGVRAGLTETLVSQLAKIGVKPDQIAYVAVSHNHGDHISQSASFPKATLLIGAQDFAEISAKPAPPGLDPKPLAPWIDGGSPVDLVKGDKDVFGDGSVMMLSMPGHTEGHHGLLVRLKETGPVLLSGDLYHLKEQLPIRTVPSFNANRAETLASMERYQTIAKNLGAVAIIQHEEDDIAKLPAFPQGAK